MTGSNLFQEIEEDLQRKKMAALWAKYGPYVVGAAFLIVVATAGVVTYNNYKTTNEEKRTVELLSLLDPSNQKTAEEKATALDAFVKESSGSNQASIALLQEAASSVKAGDRAKAVGLYETLAGDNSVDVVFRQLASLLVVQTQFDEADPALLIAKLEPLMVDDGFWAPLAKEYAAHLSMKKGDLVTAKRLFTELSVGENVPQSVGVRAADMLKLEAFAQ